MVGYFLYPSPVVLTKIFKFTWNTGIFFLIKKKKCYLYKEEKKVKKVKKLVKEIEKKLRNNNKKGKD